MKRIKKDRRAGAKSTRCARGQRRLDKDRVEPGAAARCCDLRSGAAGIKAGPKNIERLITGPGRFSRGAVLLPLAVADAEMRGKAIRNRLRTCRARRLRGFTYKAQRGQRRRHDDLSRSALLDYRQSREHVFRSGAVAAVVRAASQVPRLVDAGALIMLSGRWHVIAEPLRRHRAPKLARPRQEPGRCVKAAQHPASRAVRRKAASVTYVRRPEGAAPIPLRRPSGRR